MITRIFMNVAEGAINSIIAAIEADGGKAVSEIAPDGTKLIIAEFPGENAAEVSNIAEPPWFEIAHGELGVQEGNSNPRIEEYFETTSLGRQPDSVPWASAFVNFCVTQSGYQGTNSAMARSWLNWGRESPDLVLGCVVVLAAGEPNTGHVGFFAGRDASGAIRLLGGNQPNRVNFATFPNATILGQRITGQSDAVTGEHWPTDTEADMPPGRSQLGGSPSAEGGSPPGGSPSGSPERPPAQPRFLKGRMPQQVRLGDEVPLQVAIALQQGGGASVILRPFPVPTEGAAVRLVLFCSGLDPVGRSVQDVVVPLDADSDWALFCLRATRQGIGEVEISAYLGSAYLGALRLEVTVNDAVRTGPAVERAGAMTVRHPEEGEATLTIRYDEKAGVYRYSLRARQLGETDEILSKALIDPPRQVVEKLVSQLNAQARNQTGFSDSEARRWLRAQGEYMWEELIPRDLQELFWQLDGKINHLNILSSGDPVPWEMLYPFRTNSGALREDLGFMSERFVVSRWIFGPPPAEQMHLQQPYFVVPRDAPQSARAEVDALHQKLKAASDIGDLTQLLDLIDNGGFGLLHFASHNIQTDVLTASYVPIGGKHFEVAFLSPALRNRYRQQAPLVFMNACRSAGLAANYTHLTGWASAFVRTGVGAFIGSLWEVRDDAALAYAETFYQALLDGKSLGKAMQGGRQEIERRGNGDPTWLAYTLYGDPNAIALLDQPTSGDARGQ